MAKRTRHRPADIGSKRLISLSPNEWSRWLVGDNSVQMLEILTGEFQWVSRSTDALIKVSSTTNGTFLIANELQLYYDKYMPQRLRAYAGLAEEKYKLSVYPVVINILPPSDKTEILYSYHSEFMGLTAHQDFRVINLWEVDANLVFQQNLRTLLPFVPILKGGQDESLVSEAVKEIRSDANFSEFESLLAFFASFVLDTNIVREIMRWDMAILRESPWYNEILHEGMVLGTQQGVEQGVEKGIEQGMQQGMQQGSANMLLLLLNHYFSTLSPALIKQIQSLRPEQHQVVANLAFTANSLSDVATLIEDLATAQITANSINDEQKKH